MISSISVIIATYTRAALLDECLQHLSKQRFFAEDEVIVVDNASADDTPAVVRQHQATFPVALRLLYESQPGKSPALARGLAVAKGEILAFLDDDVNVGAGWLDAVRDTMRESSVGLMGGRVCRGGSRGADWVRRAPFRHARLGAPLGLLEYSRTSSISDPAPFWAPTWPCGAMSSMSSAGLPRIWASCAGRCCRAKTTTCVCACSAPASTPSTSRRAVVHHWVPAERARATLLSPLVLLVGYHHAIMDAEAASKVRSAALYLAQTGDARRSLRVLRALAVGRRTTALSHAVDVAFVAGYVAHRWGLSSRQHAAGPHRSRRRPHEDDICHRPRLHV
jgi:hypothetical protein